MTVKYGFFNSSNGDRVYDAEDFSRFFDGIIFDGVYSSVGNRFNVEASSGMLVTVDTGRAWFDHTWTFNDQKFALEMPAADTVYDRIDAVVLEVNKDQRKNFIKVVRGTPGETPQRPTMSATDAVIQHALAYITIRANATSVAQEDIEYVVDTSETPLASALNLAGLPSGGKTGQVLAKESNASGAVGWYNYNQLPTDAWFHPGTITDAEVIAAYKFKGASSRSNALKPQNSTSSNYDLTPSGNDVTWDASTGFFIPASGGVGLDNSSVRAATWGSVAIKYSGAATGAKQVGLVHKSIETGIYANYQMTGRHADGSNWAYTRHAYNRPAFSNGLSIQSNHKYTSTVAANTTAGILYCEPSTLTNLYHNNVSCSLTAAASSTSNMDSSKYSGVKLIGNMNCTYTSSTEKITFGSVYIAAVVIFTRALNATERGQLYTLMDAI